MRLEKASIASLGSTWLHVAQPVTRCQYACVLSEEKAAHDEVWPCPCDREPVLERIHLQTRLSTCGNGSKLLTGLVIPAFYPGDTKMPSAVSGISDEEKKRREDFVLQNATGTVLSQLTKEWCLNITPQIEFVPLGSQRELYDEYVEIMRFCHASAAKIEKDPKMCAMREEFREMFAHTIRTRQYAMSVAPVPLDAT
jgi:hypothetical protein